ncbi:unnamed protein product [Adineta ricciae]|uniref:Uncharacterized protein n=1 Tax=Adineta ricciae TaxID=249248 RepID=A0A814M0L4_ADIRI|nr:unnamed protein product [Adineta ricciae]
MLRFSRLIYFIFLLCITLMCVNSNGIGNCECHNSYKWTRDCCGPTGGYFFYRKCYNTFGLSFIQCCRYAELHGRCVA